MTASCTRCGTPLSKRACAYLARGTGTGKCRRCLGRDRRRPPRLCSDCPTPITYESKGGRCCSCAAKHRWRDPAQAAVLHAAMRESLSRPEVRQTKQRVARRVAAMKVAWCPPEHLETYRILTTSKHMRADEAKRLILAQIKADAPPLTFEQQLERVLAGARIVEVVPLRSRGYDRSLVGCAGGMAVEA